MSGIIVDHMNIRFLGIFFLLLLSIVVFIFNSVFSNPFSAISSVFNPVRVYLYKSAHAESESGILQKMQNENAALTKKLVQMSELKKDNEALRSQFLDTKIASQKLLPAKVVGLKGSFSNPTVFIINQGSNNGIKEGMGVILKDVLLGKVGKVNNAYSEVILVTNKEFTTLGVALDHNSPGIVTGFEDLIIFDHIVITDTISMNEKVITKGELNAQGIGIPPGLILGSITKINKLESKPFQNALISTPLNLGKISTVFVVIET